MIEIGSHEGGSHMDLYIYIYIDIIIYIPTLWPAGSILIKVLVEL